MFIKRKQKCLICQERFIIYKYIFITDICKKCYNHTINIRTYRKLNLKEENFAIYQNLNLVHYKEPVEFVHFVLPHPFGNIIRTAEFAFGNFVLKLELSQEHICYKRNRIVNITENILLYKDIYILNKTYEQIFNEVIYHRYYDVDSLFIQIFDNPDICFKAIDKYKKKLLDANIRLIRLYDDGKNKHILQNYADKFDEYFPFCHGQK
jgi:hypothetical protein